MSFESILVRWAVLTILFSLLLGGVPWRFPAQGRYLMQALRGGGE